MPSSAAAATFGPVVKEDDLLGAGVEGGQDRLVGRRLGLHRS